jgi:hypothetical protein
MLVKVYNGLGPGQVSVGVRGCTVRCVFGECNSEIAATINSSGINTYKALRAALTGCTLFFDQDFDGRIVLVCPIESRDWQATQGRIIDGAIHNPPR